MELEGKNMNFPARQSGNSKRIRVLLADDHHVVRSGVRNILERYADIEVVGEAADGHEVVALAQQWQPDVIVLDINLPGLSGPAVTEMLSQTPPPSPLRGSCWPPHILILSAYCEPEYVYSLFAAGAKGYLLKDESPERIVTGIRQVMNGEPALSLPVQKVLLVRQSKFDHELSSREIEVLRLVAKGHTTTKSLRAW
jgi:DNA-binding NarL/FixJ family response regulator